MNSLNPLEPVGALLKAITFPIKAVFIVGLCYFINWFTSPHDWWAQWVLFGMVIATLCVWMRALRVDRGDGRHRRRRLPDPSVVDRPPRSRGNDDARLVGHLAGADPGASGGGSTICTKDFAVLQHAELVARALLDRARPFLQVPDFGGESLVARLERRIGAILGRDLLLHLAHVHPAAAAQPQRKLDGDEQRHDDDRNQTHRQQRSSNRRLLQVVERVPTRVGRDVAEVFLDPQQLVVLGDPVRPRSATRS